MSEHAPLLDDAVVAAIRKKETARQKDRERKKAERAEKKAAKLKAKLDKELRAEGKIPFLPARQYWEEQRAKLSQAQRDELAAREQQVFDMEHWAAEWLAGTYSVSPDETDFYVSLDEGSDIIKDDRARYGVLRYPLLFVETIQVDSDFAEQLRRETPVYPGWGICADEIHLRYGYRVALQSQIANHPMFQRFRRALHCGECKTDMGETPLDSSVIVYCGDCMLAREARTAAEFARVNAWVLDRHMNKSTPVRLDSYGRR